MSWFKRFATSLRADAHGVVDALEDQVLLLKQHVRDAEEAVQRKQAVFQQLTLEAKRITSERARAQGDCERYERDAELALNGGREDLARYALKLLLPRQRQIEAHERRLRQIAEEQKELEAVLDRQRTALEELRMRVQSYLADCETGQLVASVEPVTEEQLDLELLRRIKRRAEEQISKPDIQESTQDG